MRPRVGSVCGVRPLVRSWQQRVSPPPPPRFLGRERLGDEFDLQRRRPSVIVQHLADLFDVLFIKSAQQGNIRSAISHDGPAQACAPTAPRRDGLETAQSAIVVIWRADRSLGRRRRLATDISSAKVSKIEPANIFLCLKRVGASNHSI